ncbi:MULTISPECIES: YbaK/EbsC family protein [Myxococcus]|uniref:YbaK/EbsC family protein n=1 Tax=Myxococcus TaxID=32 RepID=UPI0013D0F73B|nr:MULTISPECIES: YbaK/EbsC family protein [Myxococcus]NVJ23406.1 YbaK/prolyl-tRNA synthetase associated domain-containing protein [Myxococcus sp. AM011]
MTTDLHDKLIALFQEHGASFRVVEHEPEGRTELISQIRGNVLAQAAKAMVLMVKQGKKERRYFLAVVPGDCRVDLEAVKALGGGTHAMFAPPPVAQELTGCEMGAVPPVSFHPDLKLVVDPGLLAHEEIVFNSGRLDRSIFVQREGFLKVANPEVAAIALRA